MAIGVTERRAYGRWFARSSPPQADNSSVPSADSTIIPDDVFKGLPRSTKVLAGVVTVFGVIILVFAVCLWRIKRRRIIDPNPTEREKEKGGHGLQTPAQVVLVPPAPAAADAVWTPKIRSFRVPVSQVSKPIQNSKQTFKVANPVSTLSDSPPPPSYNFSRGKTPSSESITPHTPLSTGKSHSTQRKGPSSRIQTDSAVVGPSIIPQPYDGLLVPSHPARASVSSLKPILKVPRPSESTYPPKAQPQTFRLMTVAYPFEPTLPDEVAVNIGETVRLLDEYRDGWCLVQHVGRTFTNKGVVPRFCLEEHAKTSNHQQDLAVPRAV